MLQNKKLRWGGLVLCLILVVLSVQQAVGSLVAEPARVNDGAHAPDDGARERELHLRIFGEEGELLFSTHQGEVGATEESGGNASHPVSYNESAPLPGLLHPLADLWRAAPPFSKVNVSHVRLGPADNESVTLRREVVMPTEGRLSPADSARLLGNASEGDLVFFARNIPVHIREADGQGVQYRILLSNETYYPVRGAEGLLLHVLPDADAGLVRFRLEVEGDHFTTAGCDLPPFRPIRPGYYVVDEDGPRELVLTRYAAELETKLANRLVTVEAAFLN